MTPQWLCPKCVGCHVTTEVVRGVVMYRRCSCTVPRSREIKMPKKALQRRPR